MHTLAENYNRFFGKKLMFEESIKIDSNQNPDIHWHLQKFFDKNGSVIEGGTPKSDRLLKGRHESLQEFWENGIRKDGQSVIDLGDDGIYLYDKTIYWYDYSENSMAILRESLKGKLLKYVKNIPKEEKEDDSFARSYFNTDAYIHFDNESDYERFKKDAKKKLSSKDILDNYNDFVYEDIGFDESTGKYRMLVNWKVLYIYFNIKHKNNNEYGLVFDNPERPDKKGNK